MDSVAHVLLCAGHNKAPEQEARLERDSLIQNCSSPLSHWPHQSAAAAFGDSRWNNAERRIVVGTIRAKTKRLSAATAAAYQYPQPGNLLSMPTGGNKD